MPKPPARGTRTRWTPCTGRTKNVRGAVRRSTPHRIAPMRWAFRASVPARSMHAPSHAVAMGTRVVGPRPDWAVYILFVMRIQIRTVRVVGVSTHPDEADGNVTS